MVEVAVQNVTVDERVSAIELVGPDGAVYPARSLETETVDLSRVPAGGGPTLGLGVGGGSRGNVSTGVGLGWTFGGGEYSPRTERRTVGRIAIPDPDLYRQTVDDWQVVIKLTDQSGDTSLFTIPAPRQ